MNIKEILKKVGTAVLSTHPLGMIALPIINALLPSHKAIHNDATGKGAEFVIDNLPEGQKEAIYLANIDLEKTIEEGYTTRYQAMCSGDGQQTRAEVVKKITSALIWLTLLYLVGTGCLVYSEVEAMALAALTTGYLGATSWMAYCVRAYFGDLKSETKSRHNAVNNKPEPLAGLAAIAAAWKGR